MFRRIALPGNEFINEEYESVEYVTPKRKSTNKFVRKYHAFCLGMLDAFEKDYLKEVFMFIRDKVTKEIHETYKFKVKYNKEETHSTTKPEKVRSATVNFLQALADIPGLKWNDDEIELYMEFTYNEETPKEYEPPNFEAAGNPMCRSISSPEKRILLGSVNSGFHKVSAWGEGKNFTISRASTPARPVIIDESQDFMKDMELQNSQTQSIQENSSSIFIADETPKKRKKLNISHADSAFNVTHDSSVHNISIISSENCVRCICKWNLSEYFETIRCTKCFGIVHHICHGYLKLSAVDETTFQCFECDDSKTIDKNLSFLVKLRIILYGISVEKTLPECLSYATKEEKDYIMKQLSKLNVYSPSKKTQNGINRKQLNQALVIAFAAENSQFLE